MKNNNNNKSCGTENTRLFRRLNTSKGSERERERGWRGETLPILWGQAHAFLSSSLFSIKTSAVVQDPGICPSISALPVGTTCAYAGMQIVGKRWMASPLSCRLQKGCACCCRQMPSQSQRTWKADWNDRICTWIRIAWVLWPESKDFVLWGGRPVRDDGQIYSSLLWKRGRSWGSCLGVPQIKPFAIKVALNQVRAGSARTRRVTSIRQKQRQPASQ